jgi:hypothetical protein
MAITGSGPIKFSNLQTEFGGSNPISLGEYYRNGSYTTSNNTGVATSGTINLGSFYSATAADYVPAAVSWTDFSGAEFITGYVEQFSDTQTITGINTTISLRVDVPSCEVNAYGPGGPSFIGTFTVMVNGGDVNSFTHSRIGLGQTISAKSCDFTVTNGQTIQFRIEGQFSGSFDGGGGFNGTATLKNLSTGGTSLDTFLFAADADSYGGGGGI